VACLEGVSEELLEHGTPCVASARCRHRPSHRVHVSRQAIVTAAQNRAQEAYAFDARKRASTAKRGEVHTRVRYLCTAGRHRGYRGLVVRGGPIQQGCLRRNLKQADKRGMRKLVNGGVARAGRGGGQGGSKRG